MQGLDVGCVLGRGGTGVVYALKSHRDRVAKVAFKHTEAIVRHERAVLEELAEHKVDSPGLPRLLDGGGVTRRRPSCCYTLAPLLLPYRSTGRRRRTRGRILKIFKLLRWFHLQKCTGSKSAHGQAP